MTPQDIAYSLRRFADYATAVEEPHRQAARYAADVLDAIHPSTTSAVLGGVKHFDALIQILADPAKFKSAKDELLAHAQEAQIAHENALRERAQAETDKAAAEKHKAAAQADLQRVEGIAKDSQQRMFADEKRMSEREALVHSHEAQVKKREAELSELAQATQVHAGKLDTRKADLDAREQEVVAEESRLAKLREGLQRRAALLAEPF